MSDDVYRDIEETETALADAHVRLAELRMRVNPHGGCGDPSHVRLPEKIASLESLLGKMSRGGRTTEKLAAGREDRLHAEIARLKLEIERLSPSAAQGDHALLARVKAVQQRRRILELKAQPTRQTALVRQSTPLTLGGFESSPGRRRDAGWLAWVVATLTTLWISGIAVPGAVPLLAVLLSAIGLADVAFPGARRDLITLHMIYGERWKRIQSVAFVGGEMHVRGKKLYRFTSRQPGFLDAVRITLAAAAANGIVVSGDPPTELAQLALPIASS